MDLSSSKMKSIALEKLKPKWQLAILVSFVAAIFGASDYKLNLSFKNGFSFRIYSGFNINLTNFNFDIHNPDIQSLLILILILIFGSISILALALFIIGSAVELGNKLFYINLVRDEPVEFSILFSRFSLIVKAFGLKLVRTIIIFLWSLLLLVPGVIAYYKYYLSSYIMAENPEIGVMEALNMSKEMMEGHKIDLLILDLTFIGWLILATLPCGLGLIVLAPYINTAKAAFYETLKNQNKPLITPTEIEVVE